MFRIDRDTDHSLSIDTSLIHFFESLYILSVASYWVIVLNLINRNGDHLRLVQEGGFGYRSQRQNVRNET